MNEISFTKPVNNNDTDIDNMSLIDKMSVVCKYVASNCFKDDLGGNTHTFTVDKIWDKETGVSMGSVTINWKLGEINMSNFVCEHCGMVNVDCGKEGYKTPKEIVLEETLDKIKVIAEDIIKNDSYENSDGKAQDILILIGKVR